MAFSDSWHRTLVYFGLAEEEHGPRHDPDAAPEPEHESQLNDRYRERPNVRRLGNRRRRDEIDDIFGDEGGASAAGQARVLQPVQSNGGRADVQVHLVVPKNFNDAQQVADQFKNAIPVILNLQNTNARPIVLAGGSVAPSTGTGTLTGTISGRGGLRHRGASLSTRSTRHAIGGRAE